MSITFKGQRHQRYFLWSLPQRFYTDSQLKVLGSIYTVRQRQRSRFGVAIHFGVHLGPIHTEHQYQRRDVASNIALIKLLRFLNIPSKSLQNGLQPQLIIYDASTDTDATNQSLVYSVNRP